MGPEGYLRFLLALIFVIALIGVAAMLARRMGLGFPIQASKGRGERRIGVVEVAPLDGRRRLVLVRRDDVEHLLVVSPNSETVIETGIKAGEGRPTDFQAALAAAGARDPETRE